MFDRILVPLDGGDHAAAALPVAREMARRFGASLLLLQIVSTAGATAALAADVASGAMSDPSVIGGETTVREQIAESYISAVAEELAGEGFDVAYAVGEGGGGSGIVDAAQREGVSLILMAGGQRSGLSRFFTGSVRDHVVHNATVPVLVIPAVGEDD